MNFDLNPIWIEGNVTFIQPYRFKKKILNNK